MFRNTIECPHPNNTIVLQIPVEMFDGYYGSEPYIMFGEGTREDKQVLTKLVEEMYQVYEQCEYGYDLKDAQINYRTYLMNLRVKYAVRELMNTDHEIGDIAMGHGFLDSRAFAKAFRKRYGCLPSEYRRGLKA